MPTVDHERNPLRPVAIPLAIRALVAAILAIALLFEFAREMMNGFAGRSSVALLAALLFVGMALRDAVAAFRASLTLPDHALEVRGIDHRYSDDEIQSLMVSGASPNEKYLSWVGKWAARASTRFFALPPVYQRLTEVALMALAYGAVALLLIVVLRVFGVAGGNAAAAEAVISWLFAGVVMLAYAYCFAMLRDIYSAADWARKLAPGRIVNTLGAWLVLIAGVAFVAQFIGVNIPNAPSLQPWSTLVIVGTLVIVVGILTLAHLRARDGTGKRSCSRINLTDNVSTHPQVI